MFLADDGRYYFDEEMKYEFTIEIFYKIENILCENYEGSYSDTINEKEYIFQKIGGLLYVINKSNNNKTELTFFPVNIIFNLEGAKETRAVFSLSQYEKLLKIFNYVYPWTKNMLLSKSNVYDLIYYSIPLNKIIEIENLSMFNEDLSKESNSIEKFSDLSLYIGKYLKSEIDLSQYPEKKFLNEDDYIIKPESKLNYYMKKTRVKIACGFESVCLKNKEYFFSGNVSIGKTFTLLGLNKWKDKSKKRAYYNLEALSQSNEYFKIIAYESRYLFDKKDEWIQEFHEIEENDIKAPLYMILHIIKKISKVGNKNIQYFFIIDQIRFDDISQDFEYIVMKEIREFIAQTNNCYLIGCLSINYKGVKQILFYNWFNKKNDIKNDESIPKVYLISEYLTEKENVDNKYLKLLGNLPRYKNLKDKLNIKIINILIKKMKNKIQKFYGYKDLLAFKSLENIPINKELDEKEFKNILNKIPFKYFKIDLDNKKIDFAYPLVKIAISELLYTYKIKDYSGGNLSEYGWYIERRVIDLIKTSHVLGEYYIDNSYEIPSIYFSYKINNEFFDLNDNSLFYFSYFNVRRYDCAIYFGMEKSLLLIQIATNRTKKQLGKYNQYNFQTDLDDIQKFIYVNGLEVNKYYLLFIITLDNQESKAKLEELFNKSGLKYIVYNTLEDKFIDESFTSYAISTYTKPHLINVEEIKKIDFYLENNTFFYEKNQPTSLKCYAEIGMTLEDFIDQFIDDFHAEKLREKFHEKESNYRLLAARECHTGNILIDIRLEPNYKILFFNYSENIVYIGQGISKSNNCILSFESYELTLGIVHKKIEEFNKIMKGFIFKGKYVK